MILENFCPLTTQVHMHGVEEGATSAAAAPVRAKAAGLRRTTKRTYREEGHPCPHCLSGTVHRSRIRSFPELFLWLFLVTPYRCRRCFRRFFTFAPLAHWNRN